MMDAAAWNASATAIPPAPLTSQKQHPGPNSGNANEKVSLPIKSEPKAAPKKRALKREAAKSPDRSRPRIPSLSKEDATLAATSGMSSTAAKLIQNAMAESNTCDLPDAPPSVGGATQRGARPLTVEEKKQSSRDRNREHARCTRLRKKKYVNNLKELVDGLHHERSEDVRQRRVAVQQLAEIQGVRRKVVNTFLEYHAKYEQNARRWETILEADFRLKQPVTPYRSFPRCEVEKVSSGY